MSEQNSKSSSRRAFFLNGGAVLGAGVVTTAGAAALTQANTTPLEEELKQLRRQVELGEEREAIRSLHRDFIARMTKQDYDGAVQLFDERASLNLSGASANGRSDIARLFTDHYRNQKGAALHTAYRHDAAQHPQTVALGESGLEASATFHAEVELSTPLTEDCTAAKMARLQGQMASRRWESGRFEARYVKTRGQWKMTSLNYLSA